MNPYNDDVKRRRNFFGFNPDIEGSIIVSKDGEPIYSALARDINEELVSAMSAAILSVSERALKELVRGDLKRILIESVDGIIILSEAGENAILCTLARSDASLGMLFLNIEHTSKKIAKILSGDFDGDEGDLPFPYIFKPPTPPGDLGLKGQLQARQTITEEEQEYESFCKHCGAELPKGQAICHVCGKRVG